MADEFAKAALYGIRTFNKKVKEKIGIEKLIRYLLESKGEEYKGEYYEWYRDVELEQNIDSLSELKPFIKWLVENDKIDLDAQAMQYVKSDLSKFFTEWEDENGMSDDYAMLLMLLAIQDEPIRFLCEIIK